MNDSHLLPPQSHIDGALAIEEKEGKSDWDLYLKCLNNVPMSQRKTPREIRDGCILTHMVFMPIWGARKLRLGFEV